MKNLLTSIIKSIATVVIFHLFFLGGIYIYKGIILNDMKHDYLDIVGDIYNAYWLAILFVTILLILGYSYNFYFNIHDKMISKMAKRNEQKVKE